VMANSWVLRKGERVYIFATDEVDGHPRIEILDYHSIEDYHADAWRDSRRGTSPEYARGVWDRLVENGFTRWNPNT
jgi:hypothetical protein